MGEDKSNEAKAEEAKMLLKSIFMMAEQKTKAMKDKKEKEKEERDRETDKITSEHMAGKSLTKAYLWLIFGGFFGAHHFYLGQDVQGIVTMTTVGGIYGLGLLLDLFYLPSYMAQCSKHSYWRELQALKIKHWPRPKFCLWVLTLQLFVGTFYRTMVWSAIPHPEYDQWALLLLPLVSGIGVWLVGRCMNTTSCFTTTMLSAYLGHLSFHTVFSIPYKSYPFDTSLGAAMGYFFSSQHSYSTTSPVPHRKKLIVLALVTVLSLQGGYYYFNATVDIGGEPVKLRHAVTEFFESPAWVDTKLAIDQFYTEVWHIGILGALGRLIDKDTSTMSEEAAYIILDVPSNITSKALKKHFRNISLTYHPDKHPEETREAANIKFLEMKLAFETVDKARKFRSKLESAKILKEFADRIEKRMKREKKREMKDEEKVEETEKKSEAGDEEENEEENEKEEEGGENEEVKSEL